MGQNLRQSVSERATTLSSPHEDYLVIVGRDKDRTAFAALFDYYGGRIKSFFMKQGLNPDVAEELMQEVFVTIWRKASQFDPAKASASTWIYTIARNKRIDFLRKDIKRMEDAVEFLPDREDEAHDPEEKMIQSDLANRIKDIMVNLPEEQAVIIKQSYFMGLTHQEIAKRNNIPLGTVKSRMRLAIERLRHAWGKNIQDQ